MKIVFGASITIVALFGVLMAVIWVRFIESELDIANFVYAKASKLFIQDVFPKNNTKDIIRTRRHYNDLGSSTAGRWNGNISRYEIHRKKGSPVPLRIYHPFKNIQYNETLYLPVILWFHGGGFVLGSSVNDDHKCFLLSKLTGFLIVSVDFRLAPEYMYPAALDDAAIALKWVSTSIHLYGGDFRTIIIAGESTGGNIATALTALNYDNRFSLRQKKHRLGIRLSGLLVIYPPLQFDVFRKSHFKYREVNGLFTLDQMLWFWNLYLGDRMTTSGCRDYTICPLNTPHKILKKFPQTSIVLAKHDILVDEGIAFYQSLQKVNVPVQMRIYNDTVHGTWASFDYSLSYRRTNIFVQEQLMEMASWRKLASNDSRLLTDGRPRSRAPTRIKALPKS